MFELIKKIVKLLPYDFTQNQAYDRQTKKIIRLVCNPDSNCIDIGCHKGEVMDDILRISPNGKHFGFEPIPYMYEALKRKYAQSNCEIYNLALSENKGFISFNHVVSNPAYSGILRREYDHAETIEKIEVKTDRLDNIIPAAIPITLVKIDVEGAEYHVLMGSEGLLKRDKPFVIFEHGLGASNFYGTTPELVYHFFEKLDYQINTMDGWLKKNKSFTLREFENLYNNKIEYYFIAFSK